jgi:serine/threonine protein kinase
VVSVYDVIAPTGDDLVVYIVMEHVEAPSLAEIIERDGPLPAQRVAALGLGILDALAAAHAMGIVHRDVKPANVLVREGGGDADGAGDRVKLTDFGIALAAEDSRLTRSGVMGTHAYLAPECFDDGQVGPATDLWALGATLFHAVAARPPFERETTTATLRAILFEEAPPPPCGPPLGDAITGLLTRPVDRRLSSAPARGLLQQAADAPAPAPLPTFDPADGRPAWQAQATTNVRPLSPPSPHTTHPGGAPSPFTTGQQFPPGPLGPPQSPPPMGGPGPGPSSPPAGKSNTPLVLGIVGVAAALLLAVFLVTSGGSDDDGDSVADGAASGSGPAAEQGESGETSPGNQLGPTGPEYTAGESIAHDFLDKLTNGDADGAIAMLCTVGDNTDKIANINEVAGDSDLGLNTATAEIVNDSVYSVDLIGGVNGQSLGSGHVGTAFEDGCVVSFHARADD